MHACTHARAHTHTCTHARTLARALTHAPRRRRRRRRPAAAKFRTCRGAAARSRTRTLRFRGGAGDQWAAGRGIKGRNRRPSSAQLEEDNGPAAIFHAGGGRRLWRGRRGGPGRGVTSFAQEVRVPFMSLANGGSARDSARARAQGRPTEGLPLRLGWAGSQCPCRPC